MTEAQSNHDLQGALLHFAVEELVRHQREEFPPLWTRESWAKFLIWLALQCGAGVQQQELEAFAHALGPVLTGRLRRLFFERELGALDLKMMADPAEAVAGIYFLVGPDSSFFTGKILWIDGGTFKLMRS